MPYLSEIKRAKVVDPAGSEIGWLADVAVVPKEQFPAVQWAIVRAPDGERIVRWADLEHVDGRYRLSASAIPPAAGELPPEALRLGRDLLDKQIVDTHGAKVVRVNDLQLEEKSGQLRLVGADVGLRGLLRRMGGERAAERVAGVVGRKLPRGIIPWHLVESLESPQQNVRLTLPHRKLALLHPADIADIVEEMTADERRAVFDELDVETAAETLGEVEPEMQASIVGDLDEERAADILEEMDPDEATDLLQDLPEETRDELIELMDEEEGADVEELLAYPENSAGGIMTTDFVSLPRDLTTGQAIDRLRELQPDPALAYYLYVVDPEGRLDGNVSLRDLVVSPPLSKLADIMNPNVLHAEADTNREDVAALMAKYDLLALPVVDARRRLIGSVTVDDVMELMLPSRWKKRTGRSPKP
ncbi:MAG TPA: CBS domain-containing protein [Candidatus Limnocylindria bacterium]|nr:CBS domain-containing protein [Candidatus Limnocylindria bacterium]